MRLNEMVGGWMTENPITLAPERGVIEAYALMTQHDIRHLPVVEEGRLIGMLSDRDLHRVLPVGDARNPADIRHLFSTPVCQSSRNFTARSSLASYHSSVAVKLLPSTCSSPSGNRSRILGVSSTPRT